MSDFVRMADEEVVYTTVDSLLSDALVEQLSAASERGVSVKLGATSDAVERRINDEVPDAEPFDSLWIWSDTPAGRLLMVDEETTLVSVLVSEDDHGPTEQRQETAIWGAGETNSLVVVLKALFAWQLDGTRETE